MGGDAVRDRSKPAQQDGTIPVVEQLPRECFSISNTTSTTLLDSAASCQAEFTEFETEFESRFGTINGTS